VLLLHGPDGDRAEQRNALGAAGGVLVVADAVFDPELPEEHWTFYPAHTLDSMCHTTHSIPLSLLLDYWKREIPELDVRFIGISIRDSEEFAPLSAPVAAALQQLRELVENATNPSAEVV
jgi:hypothetical protein